MTSSAVLQDAVALWEPEEQVRLTFDTNCLIDLEQNEGGAEGLRKLVAAHEARSIDICVAGISASERTRTEVFAPSFDEFRRRVQALTHRPFEILRPMGYWGVTYWDWFVYPSEEDKRLDQEIHQVLFPGHELEWSHFARARGVDPERAAAEQDEHWLAWRNQKCDVLAMWCHIHYGCDVFVTRDRNFHKATKKPALVALGAGDIRPPASAATLV